MSENQKKIGIVGGGQLGKMMILEAKRLGFFVVILDPEKDCPAASISDRHVLCGFDDPKGYQELAGQVDVITYEFEHIHAQALEDLESKGHLVYPCAASLKTIQDKYAQKTLLRDHGIPVPPFARVSCAEDILALGDRPDFGYPLMLKATRGGYDGKGNELVRDAKDAGDAYLRLGGDTREQMAEACISYEKEISLIACRGVDGAKVLYPIAENSHNNSILDTTIVPADLSSEVAEKAEAVAGKVMEAFAGVGAFCIEFFVTSRGELYVNEVAPRPHNSGHYTIEACFANQFENHIRAIVGLPFGRTGLLFPAVMVNLLGESNGPARLEGLAEAYGDPGVHVHIYGKRLSRVGRKMGHFTVIDKDKETAIQKARQIRKLLRFVGDPKEGLSS